MRKRRGPDAEESSCEMEVEGEEKEGQDDSSDTEDEPDEQEMQRTPTMVDNPFLDSFYGLSSEDPKERSKSGQIMLQQCLLNSSANSKDAAYAFRRLLNGLCSGRAAARQGNASALSNFLNLAFHLEKMEDIREEHGTDEETASMSMLAYVRHRLMNATDPHQTTGKKKGSEERDYQFGRLFGILSIVRSNVLLTQGKENGYEESKKVATDLASDLVELFWLKKWMREPAAHAITTLLRAFCDSSDGKNHVAVHLVKEVIVPKILTLSAKGDQEESEHTALVGNFSAEQLGIALFIQSQSIFESADLPFPLDQSCLTLESVSLVANTLSETSVVVYPRTHFVWDTLWNYLSKLLDETDKKGQRGPAKRVIRESLPRSDTNPNELVKSLVQEVVAQNLLHLDAEKTTGKATHERKALAMSIIKVLSGAPYVSSVSGLSQLYLDGDILEESILAPEIVRALFLDVICAGSEKKKTSHLLKPLALEVLREMSKPSLTGPSDARRLSILKALLNCDLRFDARTKTTTISDLLGLTKTVQDGNMDTLITFWNGHLDHLLSSFFRECEDVQDDQRGARATGYVELIYGFAKQVLRLQCENEKDQPKLDDFKNSVADNVLKCFLATAFFNGENLVDAPEAPKKKKGKKSKKEIENPMQSVASQLKQTYSKGAGVVHSIRSVISARYFSLLGDFVSYMSQSQSENPDDKLEKDTITLQVLVKTAENWDSLESLGAKRFASEGNDGKDEDDVDPKLVIGEIHGLVNKASEALSKDSDDTIANSKKRCCTGIAVLAYALYLHRLSCGDSGQESDDPDADDENDEEEICGALGGLKNVGVGFMQNTDQESNPLSELAEICANLLSSPLGSGNMGRAASPKLIREAVKFAWLGGLRRASSMADGDGSSSSRNLFDTSTCRILLDAVGAADEMEETEGDGSDQEMDDGDDDNDEADSDASAADDDDDNDGVFTKAMDIDEDVEDEGEEDDDGDESDIELDPTRLQSMLEEDSDADGDEGILEHHEGADKALAKLIRLRQEARKAGKQAQEKIELSHQLRCTFLLELLFGRPDSWNRVFQTKILCDMIFPLLRYRRTLERLSKRALERADVSSENGRQALRDRLSTILSQKMCKLKISSLPNAESLDAEASLDYATKILEEARRSESKEQSSCCSTALIFVLRSSADPSAASTLLKALVAEWSTKRTTRLESKLFDTLITQLPEWSSRVLIGPLSNASKKARSPFLKMEAFQLLTVLFSSSRSNAAEDSHGVKDEDPSFLSSVASALQDEEMRKAKRVRVVLKALEKYLAGFSSSSSSSSVVDSTAVEHLEKIATALLSLAEGESQGVSVICRKLMSEVETKQKELAAAAVAAAAATKTEIPVSAATGESDMTSKKKKKKKKKK